MFFSQKDSDSNKNEIDFIMEIKLLQELQEIASEVINQQNKLTTSENYFFTRLLKCSPDFEGIILAYSLLNNYIVESKKSNKSQINETLQTKLKKIHEVMLTNDKLNWFGVPNPKQLEEVSIYSGQLQYNQRMQSMIMHIGKILAEVRKKIFAENEKLLKELNINTEFLNNYIKGQLPFEKIASLDRLAAELEKYHVNYEDIQTAIHLYRFCVATADTPSRFYSETEYINPRAPASLLRYRFGDKFENRIEEIIEFLFPETEIKDLCKQESELLDSVKMYLTFDKRIPKNSFWTKLSGHYVRHMDTIMSRIGKESIVTETKNSLPFYSPDKLDGGSILTVGFVTANYTVGGKSTMLKNVIRNRELEEMIEQDCKDNCDRWPADRIYQHLNRLYMISLLTEVNETAILAQRHHEHWYSNLTPFYRGSAAGSESFSKILLRSHDLLPGQMRDVIPDLFAIVVYDEDGFINHYEELYYPTQEMKEVEKPTSPSIKFSEDEQNQIATIAEKKIVNDNQEKTNTRGNSQFFSLKEEISHLQEAEMTRNHANQNVL